MYKKYFLGILFLGILFLLNGVFRVDTFFVLHSEKKQDNKENYILVSRVIDGDTIELSDGNRVRYIGIDTPEMNYEKGNDKQECFAQEALRRNKELVENQYVRLEKDISDTDTYERLLRYVYTKENVFINEVLVRDGYAEAKNYPPDSTFSKYFRELEKDAKDKELGMWNRSVCSN